MKTERVTLPIRDLGCPGSGASIERAIRRVHGVLSVCVNPVTDSAYIEYDPEQVTLEQVVRAVEGVGLRTGEPSVR